jgi:alpha-tubulin suppressor-like RCC1 family protein
MLNLFKSRKRLSGFLFATLLAGCGGGGGGSTPSLAPLLQNKLVSYHNHTVFIQSDGTIRSWGENNQGQLGDNSTLDKNTPTQEFTEFTNWSTVSAGYAHTVALTSGGILYAWGENIYGQLGDGESGGSVSDYNSPPDQKTPQLIGSDTWSSVAAGELSTVGIKSDGTLWGWGFNGRGQIGNGTTGTSQLVAAQESTGANHWSSVAAGRFHTAALDSNGNLWTCGDNYYGQLGTGTSGGSSSAFTPGTDENSPVKIGAETWLMVSAGYAHTVALRSDFSIWSCGNNEVGTLGTGDLITKTTLTRESTGANDWVAVVAGRFHTVALKSNGTLWAWGENSNGQLGDGTFEVKTNPVQEANQMPDWVAVAAGASHTIAQKSDGSLWAWGYNGEGQLGTGNNDSHPIPVPIP